MPRNKGHPQISPFNLISYTNNELFLQNGRPKRRIARIIGKLMGVHDLFEALPDPPMAASQLFNDL
jgi:hypothetical protein